MDVFIGACVVAAVVAVYATLIRLAQGLDRDYQQRATDDRRRISAADRRLLRELDRHTNNNN